LGSLSSGLVVARLRIYASRGVGGSPDGSEEPAQPSAAVEHL